MVDHSRNYRLALEEAQVGFREGGVPVGAAIFRQDDLVSTGHNLRVQQGDPTAHGEISALRNAGIQPGYQDTVLYSTYRPCFMCTGSVLLFAIPTVVVGQARFFPGGRLEESEPPTLRLMREHGVEVIVLDDADTAQLMEAYVARHADEWRKDDGQRG
jgi:cytosine/creatinine deaminase